MNDMLALFEDLAIAAGRVILDIRACGPETRLKSDRSPVTEADEAAEAIILSGLFNRYPDIPVIAEESVAAGRVPEIDGSQFFLVDPLDGTKEFISGRAEFTVNIALIDNAVPIAGIVYAPALGVAYVGVAYVGVALPDQEGQAFRLAVTAGGDVSERTRIHVRPAQSPPVALASLSHGSPATDTYCARAGISDIRCIGSSLKFGLLAEGRADIYPRFGPTMEWDTAAGDAVLRAAGGKTLDADGSPLLYGKRQQKNLADFANGDFIAHGGAAV